MAEERSKDVAGGIVVGHAVKEEGVVRSSIFTAYC